MQANSHGTELETYSSSERERLFSRRVVMSFIKREIRRRSRAVTAKKCTKKRDARAGLLFLPIQPIAFLTLSLSSPSS